MAVAFTLPGDPDHVRWWLVVLPAIIAALPLLVRARGVRWAAALAVCAWCCIAAASVGYLLIPAAMLMLIAARTSA